MFVLDRLAPVAQLLVPPPEPIRELPAPAAEAEFSVKNDTTLPSDHDGLWCYLETSISGAMSWNPFGGNDASKSTPTPSSRALPGNANSAEKEKVVYYLGIVRLGQRTEELVSDRNLSMYSMFTQRDYSNALSFTSKTFAERTPVGRRQRVEEKSAAIYTYNTSLGYCVVLITQADPRDEQFYDLAAQGILSKTADGFKTRFAPPKNIKTDPANTFEWPDLKNIRQEAETAHLKGIVAVQREVDETKKILHKTIEEVMQRGEKLEDLVAKSDDLGIAAKSFYKTAQKQNSCCVVM